LFFESFFSIRSRLGWYFAGFTPFMLSTIPPPLIDTRRGFAAWRHRIGWGVITCSVALNVGSQKAWTDTPKRLPPIASPQSEVVGGRGGASPHRLPPTWGWSQDEIDASRVAVLAQDRGLATEALTDYSDGSAQTAASAIAHAPIPSLGIGVPSDMPPPPHWDGSFLAGRPAGPVDTPGHGGLPQVIIGEGGEPFSRPWHFDFSPTPMPVPEWFHDHAAEQSVYDDKYPVPTQRPLLELGRSFYGSGITPPSETWMGTTNLVQQQLYLYGDYRSGIAGGRNKDGRIDNWAQRLNLDLDYRITATERFHAFFGPLNKGDRFTNFALEDGRVVRNGFYDFAPVTAFFEGDAGAIFGGATGQGSPMELPVTAGLVPLVFQNGIWMEDAAAGVAFAIPARHSRPLNWSNYDATFFAIFDELNSPAFGNDDNAGQAFGTALFIDAYGGYIETGYAYLHDRKDLGRSYHNATFSFTRRYFDRISNSVRVITNVGQDLDKADRTADGVLLLVENSWVTAKPMNVIPYWNAFAGFDRAQSVGRAAVSGGVLRNTGLNFEIDGLNGHPTLDASGSDTWGGAVGVDLIGSNFDRQWIVEAAYVSPHGDFAPIDQDQIGLGTRYQFTLFHNTIIRMDAMYGWQRGDTDVYGTRIEYRWKF